MINYYVFDLYGTLVDIRTDEESEDFWNSITDYLSKRGIQEEACVLKQQYNSLIQQQLDHSRYAYPEADVIEVFRTMTQGQLNDRMLREFALYFRDKSLKLLRLYDGVIELLEALRNNGKKVILLSNAQAVFTRHELDKLHLTEWFDHIFLSSDYGCRKPDEHFFLQLNNCGVIPEEAVMTGNDYRNDILGAAGIGIKGIYIFQPISPQNDSLIRKDCLLDIEDGDFRKILRFLKANGMIQ